MKFRPEVVPDEVSDLMSVGWKHLKIAEVRAEHNDAGLLSFTLRADVLGPAKDEGMTFNHRFFCGTDEDPECEEDKSQRAKPVRLLKALCRATGADFSQDHEIWCEELREAEFLGFNGPRTSRGEQYNQLRDVAPVGAKELTEDRIQSEGEVIRPGRPAVARRANGPDRTTQQRTAAASPRDVRPVPRASSAPRVAREYED